MRILRPLRGLSMALLWGGLSLSAVGDQLYAVALTWIAVGVLGSAAGYLGALQAGIGLVAVLGAGVWADRWESLRSMVGADLGCAAALLAVVGASAASGQTSVSMLVVAITVLAIGRALFYPALQSVLPRVIDDPAHLPAANALLDATQRIARLLGPGLVALLVGAIPVIHFLSLDALTFLVSASALLLIRVRRPAARHPVRGTGVTEPPWRGLARGFRVTNQHPVLGFFLTVTGPLNGAWYAVFYLCLPLLLSQLDMTGEGIGAYGLILSAYGCGNLTSTLVVGGRKLPARPQFLMFAGNLQFGCGVLLLVAASLLPSDWRLAGLSAAAALTGMGGPMQDIPSAVLRQTRLPPAGRAAAMRAYMAAVACGILAAMLAAPLAIIRFGLPRVMVACAAVYLGVAAVGVVRFARWNDPLTEAA
jgi:MFS transporter, DHA3 family, macrolide efflux protein